MVIVKVLVAGDVNGRIDVLAARVAKLNSSAHGPFTVCFCVGEFFARNENSAVIKKQLDDFPIPLWIIPSNVNIPQGIVENEEEFARSGLLAPNVRWLGGVVTEPQVFDVSGLKLVVCSGLDSEWDMEKAGGILSGLKHKIDILFTSQWPSKLYDEANITSTNPNCRSATVGMIAKTVAPRYHFAALSGSFFQRAPYKNNSTGFTRFHGMAQVAEGATKALSQDKKWLHALKLEPINAVSTDSEAMLPVNTTANPYEESSTSNQTQKRSLDDQAVAITSAPQIKRGGLSVEQVAKLQKHAGSGNQFFYGNHDGFAPNQSSSSATIAAPENQRKKRRRTNEPRVPPRMDCWFCLASPGCEHHLIVDVGDSVYVALPKGGVVPYHVLIVPIAHEPCCATLTSEDLDEVAKYKVKLRQFFEKSDMVPFYFERNIIFGKAAQRHAYTEVIPVPKALASQLEQVLKDEAKEARIEFESLPMAGLTGLEALQLAVQANDSVEYYFCELPSGECFLHRIDATKVHRGNRGPRIPIQFARQVACKLYGCLDRVSWKECVLSSEKENELATSFKAKWKEVV